MTQTSPKRTITPSSPAPGSGRIAGLLAVTRAGLFWERLWPALWPLTAAIGLFLALALVDVLPRLPGWLHAAMLFGLAAAAGWSVVRGLTRLRLPSSREAQRRLELDSGLEHRPLSARGDEIAAGGADPGSMALWEVHQLRLSARLRALRPRLPRAGLAAVDPFALRAALVLLLAIGLAASGPDWPQRLKRAVTPEIGALAAAAPAQFDVWINPPAYTALPPLFLKPAIEGAEPLQVPIGSEVLAQLQGGRGTPALVLDAQRTDFEPVTVEVYRAHLEIRAGRRLSIEQGEDELAVWNLDVLPDLAPNVEFISAPGRTERSALRLEYLAKDDYGLNAVWASIQRIDDPAVPAMELELALPGVALRSAEGMSFHDLTPHPWAGLAVEISLLARDALGQEGRSDPVRTVIPERIFNHPVARALVELRKQLTLNPDSRAPVVRALDDIYQRPSHYFHDIVVALAIQSAARRLVHDSTPEGLTEAQQLMWDTALHLEEGELAIAERDLREIQKELMDALARGAEDEEIDRLIDELQQALDRFLEALAEQLRDQLAEGTEMSELPPDAQILQSDDLQRLIEQARELARSGARDAARDLLSQLQNMLENLRANPFAQGMDEKSRNAFDMMRDMDSMMQRQQELLDRSFERSQRDRQPSEQGDDRARRENLRDSLSQDELRRELGEMMRRLGDALGEIPRPLGSAEGSMRDARDALQSNRSNDAVGPQTRAIDQLQQGMQTMAERFMEQMGNAAQRGMGQVGSRPGRGRDPFGRETGNSGLEALEGVEIPDQSEVRRTRRILDELRRRRGEHQRPPLELDYIDRLLRQF
jgi:uncharacterized protein (TIGR02302 family)